MTLGWSDIWITVFSLLATAVFISQSARLPLTASWPPALRWILANIIGTGVSLIFAYSDHTHPRSPPDAYVIAAAQCAVFVTGAALIALFGVWRRAPAVSGRAGRG